MRENCLLSLGIMRLRFLKEVGLKYRVTLKKLKVSDNQMVQSEPSQIQYCSSSRLVIFFKCEKGKGWSVRWSCSKLLICVIQVIKRKADLEKLVVNKPYFYKTNKQKLSWSCRPEKPLYCNIKINENYIQHILKSGFQPPSALIQFHFSLRCSNPTLVSNAVR